MRVTKSPLDGELKFNAYTTHWWYLIPIKLLSPDMTYIQLILTVIAEKKC